MLKAWSQGVKVKVGNITMNEKITNQSGPWTLFMLYMDSG